MHIIYLQKADMELNERLRTARSRLYRSAAEAAAAMGVPYATYAGHENGSRGIKKQDIVRYSRFFRVPAPWLAFEIGELPEKSGVPIVGYVGAGAEAHFYQDAQGPLDTTDEVPPNATQSTVAVIVRGDSMTGEMTYEGSILYYDDRRDPPTEDLIGRLCIVGLPDGRVLVKRLMKSREPGLYHLFSSNAPPILDQPIDWAAEVIWIRPR